MTKLFNGLAAEDAFSETVKTVKNTLLKAPAPAKEIAEHLSGAMGKGVRTKLLIACAADKSGFVSVDAVLAASAIELLHLASLVHDDIIDEADTRRGIATVHNLYGKEKAVLFGDWLLCSALRRAASMETPYREGRNPAENRSLVCAFIEAAEKLCLGELDERSHLGDVELSPRAYLRIIDRKTAALFCLAARAGAMTADLEPRQVRLLVRFARYLGYVFQILDDIGDFSGDKKSAGKPVGLDIMSGVVTLPVIIGCLNDPPLKSSAADVIRGVYGIEAFRRRLSDAKGVEGANEICRRYAEKAGRLLNAPELSDKRGMLKSLLDKIC
jgi:heptaprenyl diphosphate synthase